MKPTSTLLNISAITRGIFFFTLSLFLNQNLSSQSVSIRSGLSVSAGMTHLNIDDSYLPELLSGENYTFGYDFFYTGGAMVVVDPGFSRNIEFVFDPSFAKFSYGNMKESRVDNIKTIADIDVQEIKFPLSVRYSLGTEESKIKPFTRAGGSIAYVVDTEAYFYTQIFGENAPPAIEYYEFDFALAQASLFLSLGLEFNFNLIDYTIELMVEKGDGIHKNKLKNSYLKSSNTTSFALQLGILF